MSIQTIKIYYDDNTTLKGQYDYDSINRVKIGSGQLWYPNGQLKLKRSYGNGNHQSYYENGQPRTEYTVKDGKKDGLVQHWYPNGQPKSEYTIKDGKKDGLSHFWFKSGRLSTSNYVDGIKY